MNWFVRKCTGLYKIFEICIELYKNNMKTFTVALLDISDPETPSALSLSYSDLQNQKRVHESPSYFSSSGHYLIIFSPSKSFNSILFCTPYRQPWRIATSMTVISLKALERRREKNQIDTQTTIYVAVSIKMIYFATNNLEFQCM